VLESNGLVINDTLSLLIVKYFPYQIEKEKRKKKKEKSGNIPFASNQ